jgi:acyl-coenzyme A synthetase/AMP-(fatty) acid ligase
VTVTSLGRLFVSGRATEALMATRDDAPLPFGRFAAGVAHTAAAVSAAGATRGAVLSADPYRFLIGLFGLLHAGATVVLPPDGMPSTLTDLRDRFDVLLTDDPPPADFAVIPIPEGQGDAGQHGAMAIGALDPERAMLEFFTSGSTGSAKLIAKPLAMLDREIATLDGLWGASMGGGLVLATVPHRHIFGLTFHLLWPLATGRAFASHVDGLWEPLLARDLAGAVLVTSPAHLMRLGGIERVGRGCGPARVFTAGAPLLAVHAREAADVLGVPPTEIFGSTETGAIATRTAGEAWTPLPGIEVSANDDGRMIVRSPYGPANGAGDPAPFLSADRIEMTGDGGFHFLGRADRIAKIEGRRVNLVRLEEELSALPSVLDAAALVLGDAPGRLAAAIVLNDEGRARLDMIGAFRLGRELRQQLSRRLEAMWLPKSWRFVDALPRGAMGKRSDADTRALFASRKVSAS